MVEATSLGWKASLIEQAKEELEMLEAQQPNKFNHLKMEIKQFISLMELETPAVEPLDFNSDDDIAFGIRNNTTSIPISSPAKTQASSTCSRKKRKNSSRYKKLMLPSPNPNPRPREEKKDDFVISGGGGSKHKFSCRRLDSSSTSGGYNYKYNERKDSIDEVIRRAEACLQKIQHFKTNFY